MTKPYPFIKPEDVGCWIGMTSNEIADKLNSQLSRMFKPGYTRKYEGHPNFICTDITNIKCPGDTHTAHVFLQPIESKPDCCRQDKHESFKSYGWDYCGLCGEKLS